MTNVRDSVELAKLGNSLLGECHPYNIDNIEIHQVGGFFIRRLPLDLTS